MMGWADCGLAEFRNDTSTLSSISSYIFDTASSRDEGCGGT